MKIQLLLLSATLCVGSLAITNAQNVPAPVTPSSGSVEILPPTTTNTGYTAKVTLDFNASNVSVNWPASPTRAGNDWSLDVAPTGFQRTDLNTTFTKSYSLGTLAVGNYRFILKHRGTVLAEKGFSVLPASTATLTINSMDSTAVTAQVGVTFQGPARITSQSAPRLEGTRYILEATAEPVVIAAGVVAPPPTANLNYALGAVPAGSYTAVFRLNGTTKAERPFSIVAPPPIPDSTVTLTVDVTNPAAISARAVVAFQGYASITGQSLRRDGNAFFLDATATSFNGPVFGPDGLPPPYPTIPLNYMLGSLPAGEYTATFRLNGKAKADTTFTVAALPPPPPPPPPPAKPKLLSLKPILGQLGYKMEAVIYLPTGIVISSWGTVAKDQNQLKATVTFAEAVTPAVVRTERHLYDLGDLAQGAYKFTLCDSTTKELGMIEFAVGAPPPPQPPPAGVALGAIEFGNQNGLVKAEVRLILLDPTLTVTDWGTPVRDGANISINIAVGPNPPPAAGAANVVSNATRVYELGALPAGQYTVKVFANSVLLGSRPLRVGTAPPPPPPPPPPVPHVAFIRVSEGPGDKLVELGVILPRPDLDVLDWGTPSASGRVFEVSLTIGPPPTDPPQPGNVAPANPVDPAAGVAELNLAAVNAAAGAAPIRLVRHTYNLGTLTPGGYAFVVKNRNLVLARRPFFVADNQPQARLNASPVTRPGEAAHRFSINFKSPLGMRSIAAAKVTVTAPDGTPTETKFLSEMFSMDPLGVMVVGNYEIAPPGGAWDRADNGRYKVTIDNSAVLNKAGDALGSPDLGVLLVRIYDSPPPPPPLRAEVAVSQANGTWTATVSIPASTLGSWRLVKAHDPVAIGASLNLRADVEPANANTDPATLIVSYDLGQLMPGRYHVVFKSNKGHCGTAIVEVAGETPPVAIDAWRVAAFAKADFTDPRIGDDAADSDGDRLNNLAEYAFGLDPNVPDAPWLKPEIVVGNDGIARPALNFRRLSDAPDIRCIIEVSRDLRNWVEAGAAVQIVRRTLDVDGTEEACACQNAPAGSADAWPFMRVRVERLPAGN